MFNSCNTKRNIRSRRKCFCKVHTLTISRYHTGYWLIKMNQNRIFYWLGFYILITIPFHLLYFAKVNFFLWRVQAWLRRNSIPNLWAKNEATRKNMQVKLVPGFRDSIVLKLIDIIAFCIRVSIVKPWTKIVISSGLQKFLKKCLVTHTMSHILNWFEQNNTKWISTRRRSHYLLI